MKELLNGLIGPVFNFSLERRILLDRCAVYAMQYSYTLEGIDHILIISDFEMNTKLLHFQINRVQK